MYYISHFMSIGGERVLRKRVRQDCSVWLCDLRQSRPMPAFVETNPSFAMQKRVIVKRRTVVVRYGGAATVCDRVVDGVEDWAVI